MFTEEVPKEVVDEAVVELERRRRAPDEEEEVLEEVVDQLAVEARTADVEAAETVVEGPAKEKLAHFRALTRPYYTYQPEFAPAEK